MARITRLTPPRGRLWHLVVAAAALLLGGGADRIEFPPEQAPVRTQSPVPTRVPSQPPTPAQTASPSGTSTTPSGTKATLENQPPAPPQPAPEPNAKAQKQLAALPPDAGKPTAEPALAVVQWGLGNRLNAGRHAKSSRTAVRGGPLYFWMTLNGTQAAVDRLRNEGELAIQLHWAHDGAAPGAGARGLTTELTVGRRSLAPYFADQVRKKGHFEWHSWARKDVVSRGKWTVSLTYPDGQPVLCGEPPAQPCRFSVTVGEPAG